MEANVVETVSPPLRVGRDIGRHPKCLIASVNTIY